VPAAAGSEHYNYHIVVLLFFSYIYHISPILSINNILFHQYFMICFNLFVPIVPISIYVLVNNDSRYSQFMHLSISGLSGINQSYFLVYGVQQFPYSRPTLPCNASPVAGQIRTLGFSNRYPSIL